MQLRLCRRALQDKKRWTSAEPTPKPITRLASSSPQGSSSNSSDFRRQERHGDPSNTLDETDYQNTATNSTPLEAAIVATQEAAQSIHIAGRPPADRNVASVQPMERANEIQSPSRRRPQEGSDDADVVVRPNRAYGFHPKN
ncbi:hypothetical protein D1007_37612 [Hordeum vulgare]|nr:hypothetical protein D1007_37612 [Hordeum vulgare]